MTTTIRSSSDGTYGAMQVGGSDVMRFGADNSGQLAGFRNVIINGSMQVAQRAATYNLTNALSYGSVDRWFAGQNTTAGSRFAQLAYGANRFQNLGMFGRLAASATTGAIYCGQTIEYNNCVSLQGKEVTFSFYAYAGANFSGGSIAVVAKSGTVADEGSASMVAGTWTGTSTLLNATQALTTSLTRYTFTFTVPANAKELGVYLVFNPTGTAGADDNVYFTGAQLEQGAIATPFEHRHYGLELSLCQRYYQAVDTRLGGYTSTGVTNTYDHSLPVTMRTSPTITVGATSNVNTTGATVLAGGPSFCIHSSTGAASGGFVSVVAAALSAEI